MLFFAKWKTAVPQSSTGKPANPDRNQRSKLGRQPRRFRARGERERGGASGTSGLGGVSGTSGLRKERTLITRDAGPSQPRLESKKERTLTTRDTGVSRVSGLYLASQ